MADVVGKRISELANNASIDGTAIFPHTQNGSTMRVSLANVTDYILAQVDEDTVKDAVNEWMTDHPDVTTTVQDGAISTVKLANDAVTSEKIKNGTIAGIDLSMDLLNAICASGSASGSVATFHDGAYGLPLKSCIVSVNPVQSGSGDPSPSNIRPITGWTGATVTRTGKNLLDLSAYTIGRSENGITYTVNDDMTISASGTATGTSSLYFTIPIAVAKKWAGKNLNGAPSVNGCYLRVEKKLTPYTRYAVDSGSGAVISNDILNETGDVLVLCRIDTGITVNGAVFKPMIRDASFADSAYEPYNGASYPVTWSDTAGTVYGGTLDVTNGVLTVDKALVDLGTLDWVYVSDRYFYAEMPSNSTTPIVGGAQGISSQYLRVQGSVSALMATDGAFTYNNTGFTSAKRIFIRDTRYTDATSFETAMSGVQLVYELATPQTYQLTPVEINSLAGLNNIWADCGDVSVEYFANTQAYIEQRINATKSIITGVEAGFVATQNYASGSLLIVGDTLYLTSAAIANGAAIVPGTNCTPTTVADNLGGSGT